MMSAIEHRRTYTAVDLALFAAATWNPHMIHLRPEAAAADDLPGVVAQAHFLPATVLSVLDGTEAYRSHELAGISWRNRAPVLEGQEVHFVLEPEEDEATWTWMATVDGRLVAEGLVSLRRRDSRAD